MADAEKKQMAKLPVTLGDIHVNNINQLRKLNETCFPVTYADKFYNEIPTLQREFTQFAYSGGFSIGAVCGRVEATPDPERKRLYIMTIGVLIAYRGRGVGRFLLDYLVKNAEERSDLAMVYLHVQTSNAAALDFYKNAGFENLGKIEGYYKRIDPPDCFLLGKVLRANDNAALPQLAADLGVVKQ